MSGTSDAVLHSAFLDLVIVAVTTGAGEGGYLTGASSVVCLSLCGVEHRPRHFFINAICLPKGGLNSCFWVCLDPSNIATLQQPFFLVDLEVEDNETRGPNVWKWVTGEGEGREDEEGVCPSATFALVSRTAVVRSGGGTCGFYFGRWKWKWK